MIVNILKKKKKKTEKINKCACSMMRGVIVPFQTFIFSVFARSLRSNFYELHFRALNVVCVSQKIDFVFLIGWFAGLKVDLRTFLSPVGEIVRNKCSLLFRIFFEE